MKHILSILSGLSMIAFSGQALSQTYSSSAAVTVISSDDCPGLGAASSSLINVTGPGTINTPSDVFININMTSGCLAAARIVLVAPNGDSCILLNLPYRTGSCAGSCLSTNPSSTLTFNATNTTPIPPTDPVPAGNYAPTGSIYAPETGNLNTFLTGKSINGTWALRGRGDAGSLLILDSWSIVFGSTALPLDLLGFSGYAYAGYNELQWSTASEKNTASFDIQRTLDGVTYQTIGKVAATGFGSNQYSFRDQGHTSGVNLYRLRMTDNSGEYTYSKTVKISGKTEKEAGIKFAPNPVKDIFNITVTDKALLHTDGKIINSLGQVVYTFKIDQENIRHNLSHLPAGVYFIRLNSGNHTRFVKEN